jgi:hypothetical protein
MVEMLELQRFSATTKENVGDPTMKVTVEQIKCVRTDAEDSNGGWRFE